jgi:F-type H+-transporting ATPase subunit b
MDARLLTTVFLSDVSPIDLDASFLVQMASFFIAFFILKSLVFGPVMALMDEREAAMDGSRKQAAELERDADAMREKLESELRRVRKQGGEEREKLRTTTQKLARELTDGARREQSQALQHARERLDREATSVRVQTKTEVPELAQKIAERLLGRSVS